MQSSIVWLAKNSSVHCQISDTDHVSAANREKEGLLLTYIDSGHFVVHSSYTKRRGVEKSLRMVNTPSATQLRLSKNLCCLSRSVSSHFTTSSPRAVKAHSPATPPKRLVIFAHTALSPCAEK